MFSSRTCISKPTDTDRELGALRAQHDGGEPVGSVELRGLVADRRFRLMPVGTEAGRQIGWRSIYSRHLKISQANITG